MMGGDPQGYQALVFCSVFSSGQAKSSAGSQGSPCVPWTPVFPGRQVKAWCDKISSHLRTWSHVEATRSPGELPQHLVACC